MSIIIYLIIFILQVIAPIGTFILIVVTFFNESESVMAIFNWFAVLYFIGYFTSSFGARKTVPIYEKSSFELKRPFAYSLVSMIFNFLSTTILVLIISYVFGTFDFFLQNMILTNWIYRIIKYFLKGNNRVQSNDILIENDNISNDSDKTVKNLLERFNNAKTTTQFYELHQSAEMLYKETHDQNYLKICKLTMLGDQVLTNSLNLSVAELDNKKREIDEIFADFNFNKNDSVIENSEDKNQIIEHTENEIYDYTSDEVQVDSTEELLDTGYLETREKDLYFTADYLTIGYRKLKSNYGLNNGISMFGVLFINEITWIEAEILSLDDIISIMNNAKKGTCKIDDIVISHSQEVHFDKEIEYLVNLSMQTSCIYIHVNKPKLDAKSIIDYVISKKEQIVKVINDAFNDIHVIGDMKFITEINLNNGMKKFSKLIERFNQKVFSEINL